MIANSRIVVSCPRELLPSLASLEQLHAFTSSEESAESLRRSWMRSLVAKEGFVKAVQMPITGISVRDNRVEVSSDSADSVYDFKHSLLESLQFAPTVTKEFSTASILSQECDSMLFYKGKALRDLVITTPTVVLSGSFNPLHIAHIELARRAANLVGADDFLFELAIKNADKGSISEAELNSRIAQFEALNLPLIVTESTLFKQKLKHFQNCYFVMGYDTVIRVLDPVYYNNSDAERMLSFGHIMQAGLKIIVAGRNIQGVYKDLSDIELPTSLRSMFISLPEFDMQISSTDIRSGRATTGL